jgi:hypothetical protein
MGSRGAAASRPAPGNGNGAHEADKAPALTGATE